MVTANDNSQAPSPQPPPGAPPPVYRAALADLRGKVIGAALAAWLVAHVVMGILLARRLERLEIYNLPKPTRPDKPLWFDAPDLQVGIQVLENFGSSLLHSIAWQVLALACFGVALVITLTARLRVVVTLFPPVLFLLAAFFQLVAYAVHSPYLAQGNAIFTLVLAGVSVIATWRLAPRNSGLADLRRMAGSLLRQCRTDPIALVLGPIFGKDVRVLGRHRGTYLIRALYPLVLLALLSMVYLAASSEANSNSSGAARLQTLQEIAPYLALFIAWTQYAVLLFVAAALTAPSICDERRTRTLASLMTTPMNAPQIIMGKLSSRLVHLIILGFVSLPFLLGIRVFGGLDAEAVLAFVTITLSSTLLMAALGTLASTWSRKPAGAVALALFLFLGISFGPPILIAVASINSGGPPPDELFALSSPLAMGVVSFSVSGEGPPIPIADLSQANAVVNLALAVAAVFFAAISLRSVMMSERALEAPKRSSKRARRRAAAAASTTPAADPLPGAPSDPPAGTPAPAEVFVDRDSVVSDNPLRWREFRQPVLGSRRMLVIASCIVGALLLWLYSEVSPKKDEPHNVVAMIGMVLLVLQAAIISTSTITGEKDASTWLTLLTTPLSGRQILFPKLFGSFRKLWFISAIIGADLALGVLLGAVHPILLLHLAIIIAATGVFLCGTGVFFSLLFRRSASATFINILLAAALWMGLPMGAAVIEEFLLPRGTFDREALLTASMYINPIALAAATVDASRFPGRGWDASLPGRGTFNIVEFTALLIGVGAVGSTIGLACVAFAASRFNRLAGRTS
jgi:ABC-type transport system involved in multi-copper enzyme maturation permease subunit